MSKKALIKLVEQWFYSDLDIEFALKDKTTHQKAICIFESDVYYEHINDPKRDITIKTIRHNGTLRRFIGVECSDYLYGRLKQYCNTTYTLKETLNLIEDLAEQYYILNTK